MTNRPGSILEHFQTLEDYRRDNDNKRHEFIDILVIALCGMLSAADDWVSIAEYGEAKKGMVFEVSLTAKRYSIS